MWYWRGVLYQDDEILYVMLGVAINVWSDHVDVSNFAVLWSGHPMDTACAG